VDAKREIVRDPREARSILEEKARAAGFDLVGVTGAEPLTEGGEQLKRWQEAGMAADMGYMHRAVELLSDPRRLQKSARSVVSLGVSYYPGEHPENLEGVGSKRGRSLMQYRY
jgi:epoxyqueuosine reductase